MDGAQLPQHVLDDFKKIHRRNRNRNEPPRCLKPMEIEEMLRYIPFPDDVENVSRAMRMRDRVVRKVRKALQDLEPQHWHNWHKTMNKCFELMDWYDAWVIH